MADENKVPAGSEPINPIDNSDVQVRAQGDAPAEVKKDAEVKTGLDKQSTDKTTPQVEKLQKMFDAGQTMIGKQATELGDLRAQVEQMAKSATPAESEGDQLQQIYKQIDSGDMDIAEGMQKALEINSRLTASQLTSQFSEQQRQDKIGEIQATFLKENPDYNDVLESGELNKYLEADPMADEYVAYVRFKHDSELGDLKIQHEQEVAEAKESGARLAKGADSAGKVIGRNGGTAATSPSQQQPFKNNQEASTAMMQTLKDLRSVSPQ